MPIKKNMLRLISSMVLPILLVACGASGSDAETAARQQSALAATVAAGSGVDTVVRLAAGSTAVPTAAPAPTLEATTAPAAIATLAPTIAATTAATLAAANTVVAATIVPSVAPTAIRPTTAPSAVTKAAAPTAAATHTQAPTTEPTAVLASPLPPSPTRVPASPVPASPVPTQAPAPPSGGGTVTVSFTDLYSGASITGPILSDKAAGLNGRRVVMKGYMAPPLKPDLDFFVLTKEPMVFCPFCSSSTDWPFDIVFVRMANGTVPPVTPTHGVRVVGTFQTGTATDPGTGFVSEIRIIADSVDETE